jgi:hypothetical protein
MSCGSNYLCLIFFLYQYQIHYPLDRTNCLSKEWISDLDNLWFKSPQKTQTTLQLYAILSQAADVPSTRPSYMTN